MNEQEEVQVEETEAQSQEEAVEQTLLTAEQEQIQALQLENETLADKVLRAQAELANVQKRQAKERQDLLKYRSQKLAEQLLPVLDSLEHALAIDVVDEQGQMLKKGIEMAYANFIATLQSEGIEKIDALNKPFDPVYHHAVQQVEKTEEQASDSVAQVLQSGYTLHERVIRPAMVVVTL